VGDRDGAAPADALAPALDELLLLESSVAGGLLSSHIRPAGCHLQLSIELHKGPQNRCLPRFSKLEKFHRPSNLAQILVRVYGETSTFTGEHIEKEDDARDEDRVLAEVPKSS
jgi:hypothetical protein